MSSGSGNAKSGGHRSPVMTYGLIALGVSAAAALLLYFWLGWDFYWLWLLAVNVVAFVFYRFDKRRSEQGGMRVPEVVLLWLTLLGGFIGAGFGMYIHPRHKTKKTKFVLALLAGAVIQAGILYFFYIR